MNYSIVPTIRIVPDVVRLMASGTSSTPFFAIHARGEPIEIVESNMAGHGLELSVENDQPSGMLRLIIRKDEQAALLDEGEQQMELMVREVDKNKVSRVPVRLTITP